MDYNNMYAQQYVRYAGGAKADMTAWRQSVFTDQHSVSVLPNFIDSSISLELSDYTGISCPMLPSIRKDIQGYIRASTTTMGAYNGIKSAFDLGVEKIICRETEVVYPQLVPIEIEIANTGNIVNIDSATFGWSINGIV
jgi:hypothetical protein